MTVLPFVFSAMNLLAPARDHSSLAAAIASRVDAEAPLFVGDLDKRKTAAWLVAIAYRESSLRLDAVGDHGRSYCAFQIHESAGGSKALLVDAGACVAKAFAILRMSAQQCSRFPLAIYASGPGGCSNVRAQRISNDRMWLAKKLDRETVVSEPERAGIFLSAHATSPRIAICPRRSRDEGLFSARRTGTEAA